MGANTTCDKKKKVLTVLVDGLNLHNPGSTSAVLYS